MFLYVMSMLLHCHFLFYCYGDHRDLHVLTPSVPTRRSSDLNAAREQNVIDLVARDRTDLLAQLDGRTVAIGGREAKLATRDLTLVEAPPNWRTRFLGAITDPNVALILMMIGVYGLMFEFMTPGALYPGTIGAICLLPGLSAFSALPVNYAGAPLILFGLPPDRKSV